MTIIDEFRCAGWLRLYDIVTGKLGGSRDRGGDRSRDRSRYRSSRYTRGTGS